MQISVVIPTCNRRKRLLNLLGCLIKSLQAVQEVIVIDAGEDRLSNTELKQFEQLNLQYISSAKSVCIQRNKGISMAQADWIFICDDDIEPPEDYLLKLCIHIQQHAEAGAVAGLILQKEKNEWVSNYSVKSGIDLIWKYIFHLSIWGPLEINSNFLILKKIRQYYFNKKNHITKAGWPVITNFTGDYFETPVYGLGASLIKKDWLLTNQFDETLDAHGIGDNYGVAAKFPANIHVVNNAFVYHHQAANNRLHHRLAYYRRILALDYFRQTIPSLNFIKKRYLLWSLNGNFLRFLLSRNFYMLKPTIKAAFKITFNKNDYLQAALKNKKITTPVL